MPIIRRSVLAGLLAGLLVPSLRAAEGSRRALVMYRRHGCPWCRAWDRDVGAIYPRTEFAVIFPLREVDLDRDDDGGYELARPVRYTPTFVLVQDGEERARIEGYPGEEFFWTRLEMLVADYATDEPDADAMRRDGDETNQQASGG